MRLAYWILGFWIASMGSHLCAQIDAEDSARMQKIAAYEFTGPKWKNGVSLDLFPEKAGSKIDEAGRSDACEFIVAGARAWFCQVGSGMGMTDLLSAAKQAGLDPDAEFPVEDAFLQNQERGDGFLAGDGRAIWAFERKVDAMTDEVTYSIGVASRQTGLTQGVLGLFLGGDLGNIFGQSGKGSPQPVSLEFDEQGTLVALMVGKGEKSRRPQLRVDKNTFFELESPSSKANPKILKQLLKGQKLVTRYYMNAQGRPVLTEMDLAGFKTAYQFMMWQANGFSEN